MAELTQKPRKPNLWHKLSENPITVKELRSRMRGRRAFVVLTIYLLSMSGFISLVYLAYASSTGGPYGPDARDAGKVVFSAVLGAQGFLVIFIAPAFTAGTITGEKERQTYDLLRTTLLPSNWFVMGKLLSSLSYVFLLLFASIPLLSIAFLLGGVSGLELIVSQVIMAVAAVTFALYGLFCSSLMKSTLAASVLTFGGALFLTLGLPSIVLLFAAIMGPLLFGAASMSWIGEVLLAFGGLLLSATNLPAALVVSDVLLIENDAIFFFKESFYDNATSTSHDVWFFSPWWVFLILYILLALLLYWITVRRVRKIANK